MYDPRIGRWTTQDPEGFEAGDANLYRYVHNDPTSMTDPSGMDGQPAGWQGFQQNLAGFQPDFNPNSIPADRVLGMVRDGLAQKVSGPTDGEGYVYIADSLAPGVGYEMILQPRRVIGRGVGPPSPDHPGLPGEIAVHIDQNDPSFGSTTNRMSRNGLVGRDIYWVVSYQLVDTNVTSQNRTPRAQVAVDNYLAQSRQEAEARLGPIFSFGANLIPLVAGIRHAVNGDWGEAKISFASDGAMLLSFGASKVLSAGRTLTAIRLGNIGVQGTVAGIRGGQAGFAFYNGNDSQAWGYLGEATLRLLGMAPSVIAEIRALRGLASRNIPIQVGSSRATVSVSEGTATVVTDYAHNLTDRQFFASITETARRQGATRMVVNTGAVHDIDLAIRLGEAAQRGRTIAGGTVRVISPPGTTQPSFRITWETIPEVTP